jgi:hypothetical protein
MYERAALLASPPMDAGFKGGAPHVVTRLAASSYYAGAMLLTAVVAAAAAESRYGMLVSLGVVAGTALLIMVWAWPQLLAPGIVVGFALQPDLKFFGSSYFGPAKDGVAIAVILVAAARLTDRDFRRKLTCNPWVISFTVALLVLYVLDAGGHHDSAWLAAVRPVIETFGVFLSAYVLLRFPEGWQWCVRMALTMGIIEAVAGIAEQLLGPSRLVSSFGFPYNDVVEVVNGFLRSFGTMLDPFNYAGLVATGLVFAFFVVRRRHVQALVLALLLVGLLFAFVRTSAPIALALILLALIRGARATSAAFVLSAAVVAVCAFLLFSQPSSPGGSTATTLNGRTAEWARVLHWRVLIAGQGVGEVGSGANRVLQGGIVQVAKQGSQTTGSSTPAQAVSIDSSYLALISDVGLPGLALLIAIVLVIVGTAIRAVQSNASSGWILLGLLLVLLIDGFTRSSLTQFPFGNIVWFLLGAGLAEAERDVARAKRAPARPYEILLGDR